MYRSRADAKKRRHRILSGKLEVGEIECRTNNSAGSPDREASKNGKREEGAETRFLFRELVNRGDCFRERALRLERENENEELRARKAGSETPANSANRT